MKLTHSFYLNLATRRYVCRWCGIPVSESTDSFCPKAARAQEAQANG